MGTTSAGGPRITRRVGTRSRETGRFIEQGITLELIAGQHIFTAPSTDITSTQATFELKRQLFAKFDSDFFISFVDAIFLAAHHIINTFLPTVALKTGEMRNAIIDMLLNTRSSAIVRQENAFEKSSIFEAEIDFQIVWSTVGYSIYHEVTQWIIQHGRSVYIDPTTGGTAPYSKDLFINTFNNISVIETNSSMKGKGWDLVFTPLEAAA